MGVSIYQLLIVLAIVILLFGGGKIKTLGADIGSSIKGFRRALDDKAIGSDTDVK